MKETIGIIGGEGKMGNAFASFFKEKGHTVFISDRNTKLLNTELATKSDIVLVSVPIPLFDSVIAEISPFLKKDSLLCDITSLKEKPLHTMLSHFSGAVLGLHPMFGPSNIIPGQTIVFCSGRNKKWEKRMKNIFSDFLCVSLSAKNHDKAMSLVQGLQHFMEISYGAALAKIDFSLTSLLQVASPVYRMQMALMGRVLSQDETMYSRIVFGSEYSQNAISSFLECAREIAEKKEKMFEKDFRHARDYFGDFCTRAQTETNEYIDLLASQQTSAEKESFCDIQSAQMGVLGPKWTWTHLAAEHFFPEQSKYLSSSFSSLFTALAEKKVQKIFLPVENTISGSVREVWETIAQQNLWIENIFEFPIVHVLAVPQKNPTIQNIFGHAHAIAQCKKTILALYPQATFTAVESNSLAVQQAKLTLHSAAICSEKSAQSGHLFVIQKDIADRKENTTRFALISEKNTKKNSQSSWAFSSRGKSAGIYTSLFFELKNTPGALLKALCVFSDFNMNMVRLESCPIGGDFLEYGFFVDIEGVASDDMRCALEAVAKDVHFLGIYNIIRVS